MTCFAVAVNTKIESIVFLTTNSQVALFAVASPIGRVAKAIGTPVGMVSSIKIKSVSHYQKQYDTMLKIAKSSMDSGVSLTPQFQNELLSLTKLLKSIGGKV